MYVCHVCTVYVDVCVVHTHAPDLDAHNIFSQHNTRYRVYRVCVYYTTHVCKLYIPVLHTHTCCKYCVLVFNLYTCL